ncbi:MAG TPA: hypothetical protein VLX68_10660 [Chitinivibrionales bacterium]|nr:hypothetical protein [Chitinivibrionales bacterium]
MRASLFILLMILTSRAVTIEEINGRYLNYSALNIKGISFDFTCLQIQQKITDIYDLLVKKGYTCQADQLKRLKISASWNIGADPAATASAVSPIGIPASDSGIQQIVDGYKKQALGFLNQWRSTVGEPAITKFLKQPAVSEFQDSIVVDYDKTGGHQRDVFSRNFEKLHSTFSSKSQSMFFSIDFHRLNGSLVPAVISANVENAYSSTLVIDYDTISGKMTVPEHATFQFSSTLMNSKLSFTISNFRFYFKANRHGGKWPDGQ